MEFNFFAFEESFKGVYRANAVKLALVAVQLLDATTEQFRLRFKLAPARAEFIFVVGNAGGVLFLVARGFLQQFVEDITELKKISKILLKKTNKPEVA